MSGVRRRGTVVLVILCLVIAACAGDEPDQDQTSDGSEAPATTSGSDAGIEVTATDVEGILSELAEHPADERDAYMRERAAEEGGLVFYSTVQEEVTVGYIEDFMSLYPEVEVEFVRAPDNDILDRVLQEERAGRSQGDVIGALALTLNIINEEGYLAQHSGAVIPEDYPESFVGDWWAAYTITPVVIAWNTDRVPAEDAPTGYEDLLDERFRGNAAIDVNPQVMLMAMLEVWGEERTRTFMESLVIENEAAVRSGHTAQTQLLAAGEFDVSAELYGDKVVEFVNDGAPIDWLAPDPLPANVSTLAISKNTSKPYSAALFMQYMLSPAAAEVNIGFGRLPVLTVEGSPPELAALLDQDMEVITPEIAGAHFEAAQALIEEFLVDRAVEG